MASSDGYFKPGQPSANPGGRPRGLAAEVRRQYPADQLVAGMIELALGNLVAGQKPKPSDILAARTWLADRGWGKAPAHAPLEGADPLELGEIDRTLARLRDDLAELRARRDADAGKDTVSRVASA